jgi:hypothetical protein
MPSETRPPPGGVVGAALEVTVTLIPRDDFGEIIYTAVISEKSPTLRPPAADAKGLDGIDLIDGVDGIDLRTLLTRLTSLGD